MLERRTSTEWCIDQLFPTVVSTTSGSKGISQSEDTPKAEVNIRNLYENGCGQRSFYLRSYRACSKT